jgi:hypothetical protein
VNAPSRLGVTVRRVRSADLVSRSRIRRTSDLPLAPGHGEGVWNTSGIHRPEAAALAAALAASYDGVPGAGMVQR